MKGCQGCSGCMVLCLSLHEVSKRLASFEVASSPSHAARTQSFRHAERQARFRSGRPLNSGVGPLRSACGASLPSDSLCVFLSFILCALNLSCLVCPQLCVLYTYGCLAGERRWSRGYERKKCVRFDDPEKQHAVVHIQPQQVNKREEYREPPKLILPRSSSPKSEPPRSW